MRPTKDEVLKMLDSLDERSQLLLKALCDLFMNTRVPGSEEMSGMRWRYAMAIELGLDLTDEAWALTDEVVMAIRDHAGETPNGENRPKMKDTAVPTPGFEIPPYHVETYPIGSCVCNKQGFNCLSFTDKPGAKFTTFEDATAICERWNNPSSVVDLDCRKMTQVVSYGAGTNRTKPLRGEVARLSRTIYSAPSLLRH